jgi:hypothetical protein
VVIARASTTSLIEEYQPVSYGVEGLPEGQSAALTEIREGWIIVREIGGVEEKSVRTYRSVDEALDALEKQVNESA